MRTAYWFVIVLALLVTAILASLKYLVMPNIQGYEAALRAKVAEASGMEVSATAIEGGWSGFSPFVDLTGVELREPMGVKSPTRTAGSVALRLPAVRISLSIPYLMVGQVRFSEVTIIQPELSLIRAADGVIYFAGRPLNKKSGEPDDGRLIDWLISQPGIDIHQATLTWRDDTHPAPELTFKQVGIRIDKSLGRHTFGFVATPPRGLAGQIEVRGKLRFGKADANDEKPAEAMRWHVDGSIYAAARDANLAELRRHLNVPNSWQSGVGTVRSWLELDSRAEGAQKLVVSTSATNNSTSPINPIKAIIADVAIINARAQLADDASPLSIAKLTGRLSYQRLEDGLRIGTNKLEFRTQEGVNSLPADFSLSLQSAGNVDKERGEITANGIDLKVMTSLLEYFPIGRDLRQLAAKFGLHGAVKDIRFAWTGPLQKPKTYTVKGTLVDFSSNLTESIPGVSGISGSVEGSEKGGRYILNAKGVALDIPAIFRDTVRFDVLEGRGGWQVDANQLSINVDGVKASNRDLSAQVSGKYQKLREKPGVEIPVEKRLGTIDLTLRLSDVNAQRLPTYFPNGAANTREYLEGAVRDGKVESAVLGLKGNLNQFPFHDGVGGNFTVRANLKDVDFRYTEGWPVANDIDAELLIDNTAIRVKVDKARFFNAKVRKTEVVIADFHAWPFLLAIVGEADARAEDVSRYLRESPLVDGVGAFTKVVALEGPGKLNIDIKIPVGPAPAAAGPKDAPKFRLSGKYSLNKGSAKLRFGTQISNLGGTIGFTDKNVSSSNITGVAYGSPIAIAISGGGEAAVVTDFAGRLDVQQLGDLLPFSMPSQVDGNTDITGRVVSSVAGMEVVLDSSLVGVTSALPFPLAKSPDEARRLNLRLINVGQPGEKIFLSVAGNAGSGTATDTPTDPGGNRIEARFHRKWDATGVAQFQGVASVGLAVTEVPLSEGLWLMGNMKALDFDHWVSTVNALYPKPATSTVGPATAGDALIAGFDFSLDRLNAYSRSFSEVKIRGRKSADRTNPTWAISVASKEAEGDLTWRSAAFSERGAVRARLKRLILLDDTGAAPSVQPTAVALAAVEQDLPALDIVADEFTFRDHWLGKLELKATPQAANWRIDQLLISNGHARTEMDGLWQRYGDPFSPPREGPVKSLTTMSIKVESNNLNALFSQFGYGDQIRGGRGGLEGKLSWPGHVYQFQTASLSGMFKVNAERGQFVKMDPGAAKLLGLISLQSIPRRLTFDFRDLFSEGYAFDKIEGDLTITDGVMFAKNFDISGPAADVRMSGDIALPTERVNLTMTVAPRLSTVAAVGAGVLVSPLVGFGVLLGGEALKAPLVRVLSAQYTVSGRWDNPEVERVGRVMAPAEGKPATTPGPTHAGPSAANAPDNKPPVDRDQKSKP
ncbi:MAG: TIGR02099 family protein [Rhodocyclaceae bacterium]|nr:TIGR02099 family protein [Rhodocyclaceae bacterium]